MRKGDAPGKSGVVCFVLRVKRTTSLRYGRRQAPEDSPLTLQDVLSRADYRDLMNAKVAEGDVAPRARCFSPTSRRTSCARLSPQFGGGVETEAAQVVAEGLRQIGTP